MVQKDEENCFGYYHYLPPELKMMIVDQMRPDDRCRFQRCSRLSQAEAKTSKNFLYGLDLIAFPDNKPFMVVNVRYGNEEQYNDTDFMFIAEGHGKKYIEYYQKMGHFVWKKEVENSENLFDYAVHSFCEKLQRYQNVLKKLYIGGRFPEEDVDFGIKSLKRLEELTVEGDEDIRPIISKISRPLKKLYAYGKVGQIPKELIFQVQDGLYMCDLQLNNQEFLRLSVSTIHIHIGKLTEMDIYRFIRSWQNGEIGRKLVACVWDLEDSKFDSKKLFKLFGHDGSEMVIRHYKNKRKAARMILEVGDMESGDEGILQVYFYG